jgi:hypothetical protein
VRFEAPRTLVLEKVLPDMAASKVEREPAFARS